MRKSIIGGVLALALGLAAGAVSAQTPSAGVDPKVAAQLQKAQAQEQSGSLKAAHDTLAAVTRMKEFDAMEPALRGQVWAIDAKVAAQLGMAGYAAISARTGSKLPGQEGLVAQVDLIDAIRAQDDAGMRRALTALATQFPATLNATSDELVGPASTRPTADAAAEAAQVVLAEALLANWRPQNPMTVTDYLKLPVIRKRLTDGRLDDARQLVGTLESPSVVQTLRMDRRYDGLFVGGWSLPTPREYAEAQLIKLRALRLRHPRRLNGATREVGMLRFLRADAEALQVVEATLAQVDRAPQAFDDTARFLPWLRDARGSLLGRLQDRPGELAARRQAAATPESGQPNVSSVLDLAIELVDDDPKEALRLSNLALGRGVSDFGRGVALEAQVCAYQALGDAAAAESARHILLSIQDTARGLFTLDVALCLNDADGAAKALIAALAKPAIRERALVEMQVDLPDPEPPQTEGAKTRKQLLHAVAFRPDVQAAFAPHGHMLAYKPEDLWRP